MYRSSKLMVPITLFDLNNQGEDSNLGRQMNSERWHSRPGFGILKGKIDFC